MDWHMPGHIYNIIRPIIRQYIDLARWIFGEHDWVITVYVMKQTPNIAETMHMLTFIWSTGNCQTMAALCSPNPLSRDR